MQVPDSLRASVQALVANDDLLGAVGALKSALGKERHDLAQELVALESGVRRDEKNHRRGVMDYADFERARRKAAFAILGVLDDAEAAATPSADGEPAANEGRLAPGGTAGDGPRIFLSYNHGDADEALALRAALEERGIRIHIDREAMEAGEGIRAFIESSIRETSATVCLVSNRSLLSAWVAMETVDAFYAERSGGGRRFIACYIDEDFFRPGYRLEATERIDAKIAEIEALIPRYVEKRIDTNDLNTEKSRLYALRNNLGDILLRLKESLTLDLRGNAFETSVDRVARALTEG